MRRCRIESLGASLPRWSLLKRGSVAHAVEAGRRCLKGSHYHPQDVGVLINAGVYRDGHVCEPAIAAYVQNRLGINVEFQGRRTLSFDLLNGGCGMLNAVHVLSCLLQDGKAQAGMAVASEANSDRRPDPAFTWPPSGAAVLLDLSPRRDAGFGAFAFPTREEHVELYTSDISLAEKHGRIVLKQRKAELEEAWRGCARAAVDEVLEKDGLRRDDITWVVPAQISGAFLQRLPEALGFPREKVVDLSGELPDTLSTSTFLALHGLLQRTTPTPGQTALLLAFGAGVTVGATTYRF